MCCKRGGILVWNHELQSPHRSPPRRWSLKKWCLSWRRTVPAFHEATDSVSSRSRSAFWRNSQLHNAWQQSLRHPLLGQQRIPYPVNVAVCQLSRRQGLEGTGGFDKPVMSSICPCLWVWVSSPAVQSPLRGQPGRSWLGLSVLAPVWDSDGLWNVTGGAGWMEETGSSRREFCLFLSCAAMPSPVSAASPPTPSHFLPLLLWKPHPLLKGTAPGLLWALAWALGAVLEADQQQHLVHLLLSLCPCHCPSPLPSLRADRWAEPPSSRLQNHLTGSNRSRFPLYLCLLLHHLDNMPRLRLQRFHCDRPNGCLDCKRGGEPWAPQ